MRKIVGIATHQGRELTLEKTIESLKNQADEIYLYDNSKEQIDYTDNGKFFALNFIHEPCYFFTCDSDIIYPVNYIAKTIESIERYKTIVTYHGRSLKRGSINYYYGNDAFDFRYKLAKSFLIDVAGTGVTAFRTDYFNPTDIHKAEDKRMSDLVFSLEAAKQNKLIMILEHETNWLQQQHIEPIDTISWTSRNNCERQNELANEILNVKCG